MTHRPLVVAGLWLGIGLGGFADGILLHQILQLHNMLSARVPPDTLVNAKINMVWDGLFHALVWVATVLGVWLLWRAGAHAGASWSGRILLGAWLAGWGLFNVVEGLVDHYLLGIHHVVERLGLSVYDHLFVFSGVVLGVAGGMLIRAGAAAPSRAAPRRPT